MKQRLMVQETKHWGSSSGDRRAIACADHAGQLDISTETKMHRTEARILRNTTHVPVRNWCPFFLGSRTRSLLDKRVIVNKTAGILPTFKEDHMFIRRGRKATLNRVSCDQSLVLQENWIRRCGKRNPRQGAGRIMNVCWEVAGENFSSFGIQHESSKERFC